MTRLAPFHLAIPVDDIERARGFYCGLLGCPTGREAERWLDLNFCGHQLTLHLSETPEASQSTNEVDSENVPVRHFGVVLQPADWQALRDRLEAQNTEFRIAPTIRFAGEVGEQRTMFLLDPSGNALEFKSFTESAQLFRKEAV